MKIGVIVDNELNKDIRVLREIQVLRDHGHEIFVLCYAFQKSPYKSIAGIIVNRIRMSKRIKNLLYFLLNSIPLYEWLWAIKTSRFIAKYSVEVLHVHDLYMAKAVHSGIVRSGKNIQMILDLHENYSFTVMTYNWTKGFLRALIAQPEKWEKKEKEYLGYAQKFIVLSNEFRDLLKGRYPYLQEKDFVIMPNVPDLITEINKVDISARIPFKKCFPVILYFGVIAERRGVFDALRVFKELVLENYAVNLIFIGPVDKADKQRFSEIISQKTLVDRVHHIPWIDFRELGAFLEITDICIAPFHKNPQHESGIANKIFDYMLGKKPVIASDCLPQKNLLESHKCGIIYKNDTEFKKAIITLLNNKELGIEMGLNGYTAINEQFNTTKVQGQLLALYDSLT